MFYPIVGVYSMVGGQLPQPVGTGFEPVFDDQRGLEGVATA